MTKRKRVVITGMGAMTPLGESVDEYWENLVQGNSGIGPMTLADPTDFPCKIAGEVRGFDPQNYVDGKEARRMARFTQLGVAAALRAAESAGLDASSIVFEESGVVLGNGNGGMPTTEEQARVLFERGGMKESPFFIPMVLPNMAAAQISRFLSLKGYTNTVITACAAGTQAIGEGAEVIRRGTSKVVFAGGTEAGICQLSLGGFSVIKALSTNNDDPQKASRPFEASRDGFVPGEGAALLVLEEMEHAKARGARIYAELVGYGATSDGADMVAPSGEGGERSMKLALSTNGDRTVDYINAHGTSTPAGDVTEVKSIRNVFGEDHPPISSTKSMTGHSLGATGVHEAIYCLLMMRDGFIAPSINVTELDPEIRPEEIVTETRETALDSILTNSFGFGGTNASIIMSKYHG